MESGLRILMISRKTNDGVTRVTFQGTVRLDRALRSKRELDRVEFTADSQPPTLSQPALLTVTATPRNITAPHVSKYLADTITT